MNPRSGQFALGGTVDAWVELRHPTPKQVRILRRCYRGLEPRTYSRYGLSSFDAVLPWRTTIVKDPFALLSVPAIVACTGATPIVVYRHPGAVLASYRRMGWTADTDEMRRLQGREDAVPPADDVEAMADFWAFLHQRVLEWLPDVPGTILVSHGEASRGGSDAIDRLAVLCGLGVPRERQVSEARQRQGDISPATRGESDGRSYDGPPARSADGEPTVGRLHSFDRDPEEVVVGWRARLSPAEVDALERVAAPLWDALENARTPLVST